MSLKINHFPPKRMTFYLDGNTVSAEVFSATAIPCSEGAFVEIQTTTGVIKTAPMCPPDADKFAEKINFHRDMPSIG